MMTSRRDNRDATSSRNETPRVVGSSREETRNGDAGTKAERSMNRKSIPDERKSGAVKIARIADTPRISMRPNISSPRIVCASVIYGRSPMGI